MTFRQKLYAVLYGYKSVVGVPHELLRYYYQLRFWVWLGQTTAFILVLALVILALMAMLHSLWYAPIYLVLLWLWYLPSTVKFPTDICF